MTVNSRTPPEFIDNLANTVYTEANIAAGAEYARSRGLDPARLPFPWLHTDGDTAPFDWCRQWYPPEIFTHSLYVPLLDPADATGRTLVGFDVRYNGPQQLDRGGNVRRMRYHKFKRFPSSQLFYNFHASLRSNFGIITEGAIDAQSYIQFGYPTVGALTALHHARFALMLVALFERIYIAYDNDVDGNNAKEKLMKHVSADPTLADKFCLLSYRGKDPNASLTTFGSDLFLQNLRAQLHPDDKPIA